MNQINGIDPQKLGERLRIARTSAGLTQEDVASKLGIARTTLVSIERGERQVRPQELLEFTRIYDISSNYLLRPSAIHLDLVAKFRRTKVGPRRNESADNAVRSLHRLATATVELERMLGKEMRAYYPPVQPIIIGDIQQQAEDAALALRHRHGLGLSPISDIVSLLELELGFRIFIRPINSSISGVYAFDPQIGACILLNAKHPPDRRAMTCAHEIGHFVSSRDTVDVYIEDTHSDSREERFANAFAAAFLMPATAIRQKVRELSNSSGKFSLRHLILLAHALHVSVEAMCRRLESLGLLPKGKYDSLREGGLSRETVRKVLGDPSLEYSIVTPPRLAFLAVEAYERGLLSEGQICEKLQMDRVEVRQLIDLLGVEALDDSEALGA